MMSNEICQKCGVDAEGDIRTLYMFCTYEMNELGLPFSKKKLLMEVGARDFYTLKVCKQCRSDWMKAIKEWFETPIIPETCDSGIYVRDLGHTKQVTEEEFEEIMKEKPKPEKGVDFWEDIQDCEEIREKLKDKTYAHALYGATTNFSYIHTTGVAAEMATFRGTGGIIADMRNEIIPNNNEDYLTFYWGENWETRNEEVESDLEKLGWKIVEEDKDNGK